MRSTIAKSIPVVIIAAGLTFGCQTNPTQNDDAVASEPSTDSSSSSDSTRTKTEGAMVGALIGGLLGYAVGDDNRAQGALIGAALGAGVGYVVGNEIAKRKQQYATEEEFLDAEIASAREYNETAIAYNTRMRDEIAELETSSALLETRYRAGMASRTELEQERELIQQQIAGSDKVYEDLKKEYEIKLAVVNERRELKGNDDGYVRQLEQEINSLKQNMDEMQANSLQLAQIDERLTI